MDHEKLVAKFQLKINLGDFFMYVLTLIDVVTRCICCQEVVGADGVVKLRASWSRYHYYYKHSVEY